MRKDTCRVWGMVGLFVWLGTLFFIETALADESLQDTVIADTEYGLVEGIMEEGVVVFKGIPYAKPPVGELRFHTPEPPEPWDGIKKAHTFGPICAQMPLMNAAADVFLSDYEKECEDCLYLNVWTPAVDNKKRPVMFWIHGGAYFWGSGSQPMYNGSILSNKGDVVVVTINYRLGVLGNLTHPDLEDEHGNFGNWSLLDIIAALKWVKGNIENFGGDPENVTAFGESAGGWSVCALMISPETWDKSDGKRLFQKAISQSPGIKFRSLDEAIDDAEKFYRRIGCAEGDLSCLRSKRFNRIRVADNMVSEILPPFLKPLLNKDPVLRRIIDWNVLPVVDGRVIEKTPKEAIASGETKDVKMIIGTCEEEGDVIGYLISYFLPKYMELKYIEALVPGYQPDGTPKCDVMYDVYLQALKDAGVYWPKLKVYGNIFTDFIFRIPVIKFAEMHRAAGGESYMYKFSYPLFFDQTFHTTDIPFVFGHLRIHGNAGVLFDFNRYPPATGLRDAIQDAWINFAHTGIPDITTGPLSLTWPLYDSEDRTTLIFSKDTHLENAPEEAERAVWDEVGATFYGF